MCWSQFLASPPPDEDLDEVVEESLEDAPTEQNSAWEGGTVWNGGEKLESIQRGYIVFTCRFTYFYCSYSKFKVVGGPADWLLHFKPGYTIDARVLRPCAPPSAAATHHLRTSL